MTHQASGTVHPAQPCTGGASRTASSKCLPPHSPLSPARSPWPSLLPSGRSSVARSRLQASRQQARLQELLPPQDSPPTSTREEPRHAWTVLPVREQIQIGRRLPEPRGQAAGVCQPGPGCTGSTTRPSSRRDSSRGGASRPRDGASAGKRHCSSACSIVSPVKVHFY